MQDILEIFKPLDIFANPNLQKIFKEKGIEYNLKVPKEDKNLISQALFETFQETDPVDYDTTLSESFPKKSLRFYSEFVKLIEKSMDVNNEDTKKLLGYFLELLPIKNLKYKSNSNAEITATNLKINEFNPKIDKYPKKNSLALFLNLFNISKETINQAEGIAKYPDQIESESESIIDEIKNLFEIFGYIKGLILGLFHIQEKIIKSGK